MKTARSIPLALAAVVAVATAGLITSCNIAGPAYYMIHGPEKVPAMYVLPREKPAVVFIDDRTNVLPSRASRQRASHAAEQTLLDSRAVGKAEIISSDAIMSVASQERFGKPTGIAEIGKTVGASTVIYATVDSFSLSPDGQEFAPLANLRVKVLDVETRKRLWPTGDREWEPVLVKQLTHPGAPPTSTADRSKAEYAFADYVGQTVAQLFIEHERPKAASKQIGD